MVDTFNLCPTEEDLCFTRGDNFVWERIVKDSAGAVVDITGFGYELTVDTLKNPTDALTNIFTLTGAIATGTDGSVLFQISVANWTSPTSSRRRR